MSMATIAAVVAVTGTVMGVRGQRESAKAQEYANDFNAEEKRKQARYQEQIAEENMRRKRSNNKRELARRRAQAARGGLVESGAVSDSLLETEERLQTEVDDIWSRAAMGAAHLEGQANMDNWAGGIAASNGTSNAWATGLSGASKVAGLGVDIYQNKWPTTKKPPKAYEVSES